MSTKVPEKCPKCSTEVMPVDRMTEVKGFWIWLWNYECRPCEWVWANDLQRVHNSQEYNRAWGRKSGGMYF